ncbi:MAG: hypothetical protein K0S65_3019, partial [Labilithrix sp.]|nr:hypothetical protein [Labilithrix sp.]
MAVAKERAFAMATGVGVAIALSWAHDFKASAALQGAVVGLAGLALVEMRKLRELGNADYRKHGVTTALWHLAATNLVALAYAWFMYDGYRAGATAEPAFKAFGSAAKDWMLASGLVGSTLGLFRSTGTNSAALQALRQNQEL